MGTALIATSTDIILELSVRAIIGASIALVLLLVIGSAFRRNDKVKQLLFLLVVGIVLCASSVLFATALVHIRQGDTFVITGAHV